MKNSLEPIKRNSLSNLVADRILDLLHVTGSKSGDRLPTERELCEQLQVSRTALREGLKELQAMGVIETRHGDGSFVSKISVDELFTINSVRLQVIEINPEELLHITEVRFLIEGETALLAAKQATPVQLEAIEHQLQRLIAAGGVGPKSLKPDLMFHIEIAVASGNIIYPKLLRLLMNLTMRYRDEIIDDFPEPYTGATIEVHQRIFDAIEAGAGHEARAAMREHLEENITWARERAARLRDQRTGSEMSLGAKAKTLLIHET